MARKRTMQLFAKWHIWLGWLVGVPVLMWTVTGLVMVLKPIEEVRGHHLLIDTPSSTIPRGFDAGGVYTETNPVGAVRYTVEMRGDVPVAQIDYADGRKALFAADSGEAISPIDEAAARRIVEDQISSATQENSVPRRSLIRSARLFTVNEVPFDFRRPMPVWQIALEDGTHVYVGADTARIEAVRTRWWRIFDFVWGLHIMDLQTREDTSHPILILFAGLGVLGSLLGCILMFRRRKARAGPETQA